MRCPGQSAGGILGKDSQLWVVPQLDAVTAGVQPHFQQPEDEGSSDAGKAARGKEPDPSRRC